MRIFASLCVLAAAGLAGCTGTQEVASSPPSVSYNPPTVSYQITGGDLTSANAQAASYCQRYNAQARLQNATSSHANYQCVGGTAVAPAAPATVVTPGTVVVPSPTVVTPARPLAAMPPGSQTVAYPVVGNDVAASNASAANYCRQYGRAAQFNGVTGGQAYYTCM